VKIFLVAMRRSGTTTFFELMRQDARFRCYDEPFNGMLRDMPGGNQWGTQTEFISLFQENPAKFWSLFRPISGNSEITPELTPLQRQYLSYIIGSAEHVFIDFTRCNFKIEELKKIAPDAILIHLHRHPAAVASSHLLPSSWKQGRKLKLWRARHKFWKIQTKYDFWGFETVIGRHPLSSCGQAFSEFGLDSELIYTLPAVVRLLAFWKLNFDRVEADANTFFGPNFLSISLEHFCENPTSFMETLYQKLNLPSAPFDFSAIHKAPGYAFPDHPDWRKYFAVAGLDSAAVTLGSTIAHGAQDGHS